jgi:rubrerythrin
MQDEERRHYNYLLQYYQEITNDLNPSDLSQELSAQKGFSPIISESFLKRIGQNQVLFSAISTALLLEKDAIDHYRKMAEAAESMTLKSFFELLVKWESTHYDQLLVIQKESEVYYWQVNNFEPF